MKKLIAKLTYKPKHLRRTTGRDIMFAAAPALAFVLVFALVLTFSSKVADAGTEAWYYHVDGGEEPNLAMLTATTPPFTALTTWTYDTTREGGSNAWNVHTYTANEQSDDELYTYTMDAVTITNTGATVRSLQMGTIDNLISLKTDNYFYCRLTISRSDNGENIRFTASAPTDGETGLITVYDGNTGVDITAEPSANNGSVTIAAAMNALNTDVRPFVNYSYCLMDTAVDGPSVDNASWIALAPTDGVYTTGAELLSAPAEANGDGCYYLYLRLVPNLIADTFGQAALILANHAVSTIVFNQEWEVEVH